jgi:deazaflavin-dependent oxidoreductase (nitroreductase family)
MSTSPANFNAQIIEEFHAFASKAGAPTNPDWYHNVKANPNVRIEVGTATIDVLASEATGAEREHTGQHYDDSLSRVFFDELGLARPDRELGIGAARSACECR